MSDARQELLTGLREMRNAATAAARGLEAAVDGLIRVAEITNEQTVLDEVRSTLNAVSAVAEEHLE